MSSYRPTNDRTSATDHYRPLPAPAGAGWGLSYSDRPSRSDGYGSGRRESPAPRRHTPPQDSSRAPRGAAMGDMSSGGGREWDFRQGRETIHDRDYDRRGRSSSPRRGWRGRYRDWDREDQHLPRDYSRSRSRSQNRRSRSPFYGGPASRDVILEGLPMEMESDDISDELREGYHVEGLEEVRVIKDRQTGLSRQFGFLHFASVGHARDFLEQNYPSVYLYGSGFENRKGSGGGQTTKVRIAFCRERDDRDRTAKLEDDWECQVCSFPNYARRMECRKCFSHKNEYVVPGHAPSYQYTNTGDSDVSADGSPSQFLLFRGLEPTVTPQLLAKGAAKLYKSGESPPPPPASNPKKASAKVASTTADANLGAKEGSIRRVLLVKDRRTDESWRYGFVEFASVEDSQAALAKFNSLDKFTISSKPVLLSFVHSGVFVPVTNRSPGLEKFIFSPLSNPSMKLAYWDEEGYVSELRLASEEIKPNSKSNETEPSTGHGAATADEGVLKASKQSDNKSKKRKGEATATASNKKVVPAHLNFWRNRHAELHGIQPEDSDPGSSDTGSQQANSHSTPEAAAESTSPSQSFADLGRKCCLLCSRQFKTEAEVHKHERLSQLHRDNLKDGDLRAKALARLSKLGSDNPSDTPTYRDRAKERRAAFNQPKRPVSDSRPAAAAGAPPQASHDASPPAETQSKGAALLNKMGWTAGAGLGAQGTGIVAPVPTEMYVQGVGLGAQGGKVGDAVDEAERNTTGGYSEFLERTREKAKERFQRLTKE